MPKYKEIFDQMISENKEVFNNFAVTHERFSENPKKWRDQFNKEGDKVLTVIRHYENRLCKHSEGGGYGKFSSNLADKFWAEIRSLFPNIDEVGIHES